LICQKAFSYRANITKFIAIIRWFRNVHDRNQFSNRKRDRCGGY
jgi:hypothetical protein